MMAAMITPLPPLPSDPTGGFLPLLRLHVSLAHPSFYQGSIAYNLALNQALAQLKPPAVTQPCLHVWGKSVRLAATAVDPQQPAASATLAGALRALRFNSLYTGLDLRPDPFRPTAPPAGPSSVHMFLSEALLFNTTLQEASQPEPQPTARCSLVPSSRHSRFPLLLVVARRSWPRGSWTCAGLSGRQ